MLHSIKKLINILLSIVVCLIIVCPFISTRAESATVPLSGTVYEFGEKGDYEINNGTESKDFNTFGVFSISGNLVQTESMFILPVQVMSSFTISTHCL